MKNFVKSPTAAGAVTLASFVASAAHIVTVVDATNPLPVALVYPIGIDGLLYIGIRAMQTGRRVVGAIALLVGAVYSLAFNAHAEGAIVMDPLLIAASMPVCFLAGVLIESTAKDTEPDTEPAAIEDRITEALAKVDRVVEAATTVPAPLPAPVIAARPAPRWIGAGARPTLPIVSRTPKPAKVEKPKPTKVETKTDEKPTAGTDETKSAAGRTIAWDVAKAVRLMDEGRTNAEIAATLSTAEKQMQRARRVLVLVRTTTHDDAAIRTEIKNALSLPVIAAIRAAATPKEA